MPIEVIVAGLPRTGTSSMRDALEQLGFTKTMHMTSCMQDPLLSTAWKEIYENHLEKSWTNDDWRRMFDKQFPEYMATTLPSNDFAVELAQAYPEAKVILLYRNPDTWHTSFQNMMSLYKGTYWETILGWPLKTFRLRPFFLFTKHRFAWWTDVYNYPKLGKELMPLYLKKIKTGIAAERILEFKVQDGWAPLCKFLNKSIPLEDFPRINEYQEMLQSRNRFKQEATAICLKWLKQGIMITVMLAITASVCWRGLLFLRKI